jgi:phosphate transport system substrate-binding protein
LTQQVRFSPATIAGMYLGTIRMWNDQQIAADNPGLTLPTRPVLIVHRSDGSGTTDIFTDYLSKVSSEWQSKVGHGTSVQWPVGIGGQGNEGVANQVRNTVGGVGYIELAYAKQNHIPYGALKNHAGNYVQPDPANVTNAAASLEIPDDLRFSMTDEPGPQAYPIAGTTWVLLYKNQSDVEMGKLLTAFFHWAITDGQRYGSDLDYAALAPNLVSKTDAALRGIMCGAKPCLAN